LKRFWFIILGWTISLGMVACSPSKALTRDGLTGEALIDETVTLETVGRATEPLATPTKPPIPQNIQLSFTPSPAISPTPSPTRTPTVTPTIPTSLPCLSETGAIERAQLSTTLLSDPLEYRVYTPPCYLQDPDQSYPVLYLIHGYGFNDDQWVRLAVTEIADRLIAAGEISPIIMVMPYDPKPSAPPKNQFGEALVSDLVPAIDSTYHTIPDRQHRTIGGISRGANWAIHLGLSHWDVFGAVGGHSASLFIWDGQPEIEGWLRKIPPEFYPRIYLDIGESDKWADRIIWLEGILDDFSVPHELHLFPGNHNEAYWSSHIEGYLRWYVEEW